MLAAGGRGGVSHLPAVFAGSTSEPCEATLEACPFMMKHGSLVIAGKKGKSTRKQFTDFGVKRIAGGMEAAPDSVEEVKCVTNVFRPRKQRLFRLLVQLVKDRDYTELEGNPSLCPTAYMPCREASHWLM